MPELLRLLAAETCEATIRMLERVDWDKYACRYCGSVPLERCVRQACCARCDILVLNADLAAGRCVRLLEEIRRQQPHLECIFLCYEKRFETLEEAVLAKVSEVLVAPFRTVELTDAVLRAMPRIAARRREILSGLGVGHLVHQAIRYIRAHFDRELTLPAVAEELGVSPCHLSRTIKRETSWTFLQMVNECRMQYAKELLETTDLKIYEIAERCGFSENAYFHNLFKRRMDETPSQYRRRCRIRVTAGVKD